LSQVVSRLRRLTHDAGQTEATVGTVACFPRSPKRVDPIFGLPANLCKLCPQYGHKIIFSRKCYYEAQCPLPVLIYKMKGRAGKGGLLKIDPQGTDETKQWNNLTRPDESVPSAGSKCLPPLASQTASENHNAEDQGPVAVDGHSNNNLGTSAPNHHNAGAADNKRTDCSILAQNYPQSSRPPRRPRTQLLRKLFDKIISRSMYAQGFQKVHYGTITIWEKSR